MNLKKFLARLHISLGIFIGPFIFLAALSGALYAFTFLAENWVYNDILTSKNRGQTQSLEKQLEVGNQIIGKSAELFAIRPGLENQQTTRILYLDKNLKSSQFRTLFIDPYSLELKADLITYGSSGAMPARMWVDLFHRDLLLGKLGRWYSELAASWMWLSGITGIILFALRKKKEKNHYQQLLNKHIALGLFSFVALVFLSITGLTWSEWAGDNISKIRNQFNWNTPSLITKVSNLSFRNYELKTFDDVLKVARHSGIDSSFIEIKPPRKEMESWQVAEIKKFYPTQSDAVSIDPSNLEVIDQLKFDDFPVMAKLTRWGIDLHMGTLFGAFNQILVGLLSLSICLLIVTGYMLWIKGHGYKFKNTLFKEFQKMTLRECGVVAILFIPLFFFAPLIVISLVFIVTIESFLSKK